MNLVFICSRNQWRSPTVEALFKTSQQHKARSAGTEPSARIRVTESALNWADIIVVMEKRHKQRLQKNFRYIANHKKIIVLDIEDNYQFMDAELEILKGALGEYL